MELSKDQIQRIDGFLERLGFEYIDIRYEMVDHIATDIEQNIVNHDEFFRKNKMHGQFLGYMMRKKNDLEKNYVQQSKKQFLFNLWKITKQVSKSILNFKVLVVILFSFTFFQQLINYNIKYTVIITAIISVVVCGFSTLFLWQQIKNIGKVRVVHSYYSIVFFLTYLATYIPNIFTIYKPENHNIFVANFHFVLIFLNVLVVINFVKHKNQFKNRYKYLLS